MRDSKRAAVIDIGSNSVRLVIYSVYGAAHLPRFNEKVMAGLGTDLTHTGVLWPDGVEQALAALRRYRAILSALEVTNITAIATSAVREAKDGNRFCKKASTALGVPIQVLSGEDEARLSAFGAASGLLAPRGIVGDLGGSSLELAGLKKSKISDTVTHLLGPLSLADYRPDEDALRKYIRKTLKPSVNILQAFRTFYAVGGSWRALAKVHMDLTDYPLHTLQGYRMNAKAVRQTIKAIHSDDTLLQARIAVIARRRTRILPYAATLLGVLFEQGGFGELIISSYGVREGVLMEAHGSSARDILLDGVIEAARLDRQQIAFGKQLHKFVAPALAPSPDLFGEPRNETRILRAACLYADSGARFHPDHRARLAYDHALLGPYAATSHVERSFIALALASRYLRRFEQPVSDAALLTTEQMDRALKLGALMRLGCVLSGRSAPILAMAYLKRSKSRLILGIGRKDKAMISATVMRRLGQAASALALEPEVEFSN